VSSEGGGASEILIVFGFYNFSGLPDFHGGVERAGNEFIVIYEE
jgi:hypothetical protein